MDQSLITQVQQWISQDPDPKTRAELERLLEDKKEAELRSCFSGFLEFGTAGLRGKLGPGPSRMNRAVVTKTAAGHVSYMRNTISHLLSLDEMLDMDLKTLRKIQLRLCKALV